MKGVFLLIIVSYLGGNIYIYLRGLQALWGVSLGWKIALSLCFWIAALGLFVALLSRDGLLPESIIKPLFRIGSAMMVFTLYMTLSLLVLDIAKLFIPTLTRGFFYALGFTLCLLAYGYWNYLNPKVIPLDIVLEKPLSQPLRIAAISDVHLGEGTSRRQLRKYVELINSQQPDIILIAGDLIDHSTHPLWRESMDKELSKLQAPMGIYMALGNHEYIMGIDKSLEFLRHTPIKLLRDSVAQLPCGLQIIGRDDLSNRHRKRLTTLIAESDPSLPTILLDHQPYLLHQSDSLKVDMQISGHTHRGQVFPLSLLTDHIFEQSHGYRRWSHSHIFVSSGLSLWGPPFRIGTNSDMALINLRGASSTETDKNSIQ